MEKKFNEEAYRNGSEVVCDVCGSVIEHINVKTRIIARQAEGFNVTEQYFTCQECGKKYTVLIVDHEMQFLIQKRQQVERQIRSRAQTIQRLITKIEKIKKQQEERMIMLKEQYKEEIGS
jgi:GTP-binding protein EngB required for normal cell division